MPDRPADRFTCETCGRTVYPNAEGHTRRPRPGPDADLATLRDSHPGVCKHGYVRPCPICPDPPADPGLDADLATLRAFVPATTARVEAELARLREERDALKGRAYALENAFPEDVQDAMEKGRYAVQRAKIAEARCARLQQALREIEVEEGHGESPAPYIVKRVREIAREALAGPGSEQSSLTESGSAGLPDTPADSQPEETT